MILFSVIVPIYKVEFYIEKCIDSLLKQNYTDCEIILVDDGSPDKCPRICDEYAKHNSNIKVIHKKNGGLVSARKAGLKVATGKYIINVDGDDYVNANFFNQLENIINKYNPDIVCYGCDLIWQSHFKSHPLPYRNGFYSKEDINREILPFLIESNKGKYFSPSVWSKAIKKDLYYQYQMNVDDRISIGEDGACTKPIVFNSDSMYIMGECLYSYRQNNQSMTKNRKAFSLEAPLLIAKGLENSINLTSEMQKQIYRNLVHNLFNACVSQYNRKDSYSEINNDINTILSDPYVCNAVSHASFSLFYFKGQIAQLCLKRKVYKLMKIFCKW